MILIMMIKIVKIILLMIILIVIIILRKLTLTLWKTIVGSLYDSFTTQSTLKAAVNGTRHSTRVFLQDR